MKKIIFLIIVIILIVGCADLEKITGKEEEKLPERAKIRGSKGLKIEFVKNAPPDIVKENRDNIPLAFKVENKGASEITNGIINLVGLEKDYIDVTETIPVSIPTLTPRTLKAAIGGIDTVFLTLRTKAVEEVTKAHDTRIVAQACYDYETKAYPKICIDPDVYDLKIKEKACRTYDVSLTTQGAPVAVTKVEINMIPTEQESVTPNFIIYVNNVGGGSIIKQGTYQSFCAGGNIERETLNTISISATMDGVALECDPSEITITDDLNYFRCEYQSIPMKEDAYETFLEITLNYGYSEIIYKDIKIEREMPI